MYIVAIDIALLIIMVYMLATYLYIILINLLYQQRYDILHKNMAVAKAVTVLRNLVGCADPLSYGIAALMALSNDRLPPNLDTWPCDD